jgi:hypothetical protein
MYLGDKCKEKIPVIAIDGNQHIVIYIYQVKTS